MKNLLLLFVLGFIFITNSATAQQKKFQSAYDLSVEGVEFYLAENYEKAYQSFRRVNYNDTAYYDLTAAALDCANKLRHYDSVLTICDEILNNPRYNPIRESFMISKSHALIQLDRDEDGLTFINSALKEFERSSLLRYNRGVILYRLERYSEAIESIQSAIRYNPRHVASHIKLGLICAEAGDVTKAALCYNMAIFLGAGDNRALEYVGLLEKVYNGTVEKSIGKVTYREKETFEEIDDLIRNKTATLKGYKVDVKLKYAFIKHNHLVFDQIEYNDADNGFWNQNYVRFFQEISESGDFANFSYFQCLKVEDPSTQKLITKNKSRVIAFLATAGTNFRIFMNERSVWDGTEYAVNKLNHVGKYGFNGESDKKGDKNVGYYRNYGDNGLLDAEGNFDDDGLQTGVWKFYDENGLKSAEATFVKDELNGLRTSYFENGARKEQFIIKDGAIDGEVKVFSLHNQLYRQTNYVKGKENGEARYFFNTGELYGIENYKNGLLEGKSTEYFPNGDLMTESNYVAGKLSGAYTTYHRGAQVRTKGQYTAGLSEGHWEYRYKNNQLREEGDYKAGLRIGLWKRYSQSGKLIEETNYGETGKKIGVYKEYDLDEKLIMELTYKGEEIISYKTFDETGKVLSEGEKKRKELEFENYYTGGQLRAKGNYYKGNRVGVWKFYNQYGVLATEETHNEKGELEGKATHYFDNGEIEKVTEYKAGERDGYMVDYYRNGQIFTEGFYSEGDKQGEWKYFYRDGSLKLTEFYLEGKVCGDAVFYDEKGRLNEISTYFYGNLEKIQAFDTLGVLLYAHEIKDGKLPNAKFTDVAGNVTLLKSFDGGETNGEVINYYKSGKVKSKGMEVDGSRNGLWEWFYESGKVEISGNYDFGTQNGEWTWYYENGKIDVRLTFVDGDAEGKRLSYFENGKVESEKFFRADELHGTINYYDESGELQLIRYYKDGRMLGYSYLGADKKPVAMIPFDNQNGTVETFYYNGKKSYYSERKDGYHHGKTINYHFNGKESSVETYEKGHYSGIQYEYFPSGKVRSEQEYKFGEADGLKKTYHENGKIKMIESYLMDVQYGWRTMYKADGTVESKSYFYDGKEL